MRYLQRFWSYFLLIALVLVSYLANLFLLREILFYDAKRTSLIRIQSFEERLKQLKLTLQLYDSKKIPREINGLKTHLNLQATDALDYLPVCQSGQSKEYDLFSKGDRRILFKLSKNPGCLSFTNQMMDQILGLDQSNPNWLMGFLLENHPLRTTKEQRVLNHLKEFQSSKQHLEKFASLENESYLITGSSNLQSRSLQFYVGTTRNNIYKSPVTSRLFALHIVLGLFFLSFHWFSRRFRRRIFKQIQSLFQSEKQAEHESIEKSIQRLREFQNSTKSELAEFMEKNQSLEYVLNSIPAFLCIVESGEMVYKNELWDILENSNGVNDELFLESLQEELKQVREHGHSTSRDLRLKNRYGIELDFQVTLLCLSNDDKTDRVLLHITDTSESRFLRERLLRYTQNLESLVEERTKELQNTLREIQETNEFLMSARDEALKSQEFKSRFLARMSHEIRTPLQGILSMLRLMIQMQLPVDLSQKVRVMHASSLHLLHVVNEILDLSKLESGKLQLEQIPFDVMESIRSMVYPQVMQAQEKGVRFLIDLDFQVPRRLIGDPFRLNQIILNLIGNALKFTGEGHVGLSMKVDGQHLLIEVADTGIGMDANEQEALFDAYSQAQVYTAREYGGTGLGLSITKQLVHAMHGEIEVLSEKGKGSTFQVRIPVQSSDKQGVYPGTYPPEVESEETIVIMGSYEPFLELVRKKFELLRVPTVCFRNSEHLINYISSREMGFSQVFLLDTPSDESFQAILDQLEGHPQKPTLNLFSKPLQEPKELDRDLVVRFFSPPFYPDDYHRLLQNNSSRKKVLPGNQASDSVEQKTNLHKLKVLVVDDDSLNRLVMQQALTQLNHEVVLAPDGETALKLNSMEYFDLILMDIQMPEMDGLQTTRRIRASKDSSNPEVLIFGLSGGSLDVDRSVCLRAGMNEYLLKPFDPERLSELVDEHFKSLEPKARILVVDDQIANRRLLQQILLSGKYSVQCESDGAGAILACSQSEFDLVLMDLMMPGMSGLEASRRIRESRPELPIMAVTADKSDEIPDLCKEAGLQGVFFKPVDQDELLEVISNYFLRDQGESFPFYQSWKNLKSKSFKKPESPSTPLVSLSLLLSMDVPEPNFVKDMIDQALRDVPRYLEEVSQALNEEDYNLAKSKAHTLKGVFSYFQGKELQSLCIEVEESCNQRRLEQAQAVHQTLCNIWPIAAQTLQDFELPEEISSEGS